MFYVIIMNDNQSLNNNQINRNNCDNKNSCDKNILNKKKKKKCKNCKAKKKPCFDLLLCDFCSNTYCIKCKCPYIHQCDNIEDAKKRDRDRLGEKLMSGDCNFSKLDTI